MRDVLRPKHWLTAGLSGVLLTLAFPPFGGWPLAFVAVAPLLAAVLRSPDAKSAANLGAVAGLIFYSSSLFWLVKVFGPMAAAFWCVFALWLALYCAVLWRLRRRWSGRGGVHGGAGPSRPRLGDLGSGRGGWDDFKWAAAAGVLWTGLEYFRAEVWWLHCSWMSLGYSQTRDLPMLQTCALIGLYGLSGLIAAVNAGVALLILERRWKPAVCAAAALLALSGWGRRRSAVPPDGELLDVALVQDESYDLSRLAKLSLGPVARRARLLVWPEYAFIIPPAPNGEAAYRELLSRKLEGSAAVAVVGAAIFPEDMKKGKEQNFAWVLAPGGKLLGRYDKHHPIPYVERLLPANPTPRVVATPLGPLGIQICYDLDFEDGTRRLVREGARLLAVPNLDPIDWPAWQHRQHSAMSAARAVESGLWIARAASSGLSQIIDPRGRVIAEMPSHVSGVLTNSARLRTGGTVYSAWGWLSGPGCLAGSALLGLLAIA